MTSLSFFTKATNVNRFIISAALLELLLTFLCLINGCINHLTDTEIKKPLFADVEFVKKKRQKKSSTACTSCSVIIQPTECVDQFHLLYCATWNFQQIWISNHNNQTLCT